MASSSIDVLIIGAGPTGLMLASQLALHQKNLSFRIIDKSASCTTQSRALVIHARSLELFAQLNLIERILSEGYTADRLKLFCRGQCRFQADFTRIRAKQKPLLTRYPYLVLLEQSATEKILEEYLIEQNISIERNCEAIELKSTDDNHVEVTLANGELIRTKYVCACDGARSIVRHKLNLSFSGRTYSQSLFLCDSRVANLPIEQNEAAIFMHSSGLAGVFPLKDNARYRLFGTIESEKTDDIQMNIGNALEILRTRTQQANIRIDNCQWLSIYRSHHRCIKTFRYEKQFFFLGDAAHIHSPLGGQGMNTGLQDAHNLGWKLAFVLKHSAHDRLLDTYHDERFPIAKELVHTTDKAFAFAASANPMMKFVRLYVLPYFLRYVVQFIFDHSHRFRQYFFLRLSQLWISYSSVKTSKQPTSTGRFSRAIPLPGDRFPYVIYDPCFYHFVIFEKQRTTQLLSFIEFIQEKYSNLIRIHDTCEENLPFQYQGAILIRPDGFIAYRTSTFDIEHFQSYFVQFFSN